MPYQDMSISYVRDVRELIKVIKDARKPMLFLLFTSEGNLPNVGKEKKIPQVDDFRAQTLGLLSEEGAPYIDIARDAFIPYLQRFPNVKPSDLYLFYSEEKGGDILHPSPLGYEVIAEVIKSHEVVRNAIKQYLH